MGNRFSTRLRTAVAASGHSLDSLARELRLRGTPAAVSTLSSWQTGENHPERAGSVAALTTLENVLGLPPRALLSLLPPRRPRGRRRAPQPSVLPHRRVWRSPAAVERVLAKLDAVPEDLYVPARLSRTSRVLVAADGTAREVRQRLLVAGRERPAHRLLALIRLASLPQPPRVVDTAGCRPGRVRADVPGLLTAFELPFDTPLQPGQVRQIDFAIRCPQGQRERHESVRVPPGMRDVTCQAVFERPPARCFGYYQSVSGGAPRRITAAEAGAGTLFQFTVLDPEPGIYGVRWEWAG